MPLSPAATSSAWAISRRASDISKLRDFNMFALGVGIMATILQRASWFGNDTTSSAKTPHEQKIAGILGHWRNGFSWTMIGLVTLLIITVMNHTAFVLPGAHGNFSSHETRKALINKIADEAIHDAAVRDASDNGMVEAQ